jgi:peptidoglycan/xylan/chitin deacetylase (PgdA/CDA1 family)
MKLPSRWHRYAKSCRRRSGSRLSGGEFALVAFALWLCSTAPAAAEPVALTFDDLPALQLNKSAAYAAATTDELLAGLSRHHLPAIGFVNEGKLDAPDRAERIRLLKRWLDAGMDLGNHSYSHISLTKTPVEAYIADVQRGETVIRNLLAPYGRKPRWYRYPYLETGPTIRLRHTFERWLAAHGYRVAPVTMENADWMFALVYDDAILRGDTADAARVRSSYLAYTALVVPWYRDAARELLRRRPAFVFLLHASRLNASCIDQLADILQRNDLNAVTLDEAMKDPAYKIADNYAGPNGDEWLTRWSITLHRDLPWSTFPQPPADISAENDRLDKSP